VREKRALRCDAREWRSGRFGFSEEEGEAEEEEPRRKGRRGRRSAIFLLISSSTFCFPFQETRVGLETGGK